MKKRDDTSIKISKALMAEVDAWREKNAFGHGRADAVRVLVKFALNWDRRITRRRRAAVKKHENEMVEVKRD